MNDIDILNSLLEKKDLTIKNSQRFLDQIIEGNISPARIGAFLTSKCREEMANLCLPFIDHITMMQTDGFVATKQLDIQTGPKLGDLKFEEFGLVKIERANQKVVFQK